MKLIVGIGGHCPEHSAASNKQFIVVFQSITKGDFLGHRLSAASRVLSLAFTIIAFLEDGLRRECDEVVLNQRDDGKMSTFCNRTKHDFYGCQSGKYWFISFRKIRLDAFNWT
jgi:hypothetical protein